MSDPEPSDDELLSFAESLLQDMRPHLRERQVLEEAIQQHRATWVSLHQAATALRGINAAPDPPHAT